jgi:hypothetical protein
LSISSINLGPVTAFVSRKSAPGGVVLAVHLVRPVGVGLARHFDDPQGPEFLVADEEIAVTGDERRLELDDDAVGVDQEVIEIVLVPLPGFRTIPIPLYAYVEIWEIAGANGEIVASCLKHEADVLVEIRGEGHLEAARHASVDADGRPGISFDGLGVADVDAFYAYDVLAHVRMFPAHGRVVGGLRVLPAALDLGKKRSQKLRKRGGRHVVLQN